MKTHQYWRVTALVVATSLALAACGGKDAAAGEQKQAAAAGQQRPAPTVGVVTMPQPENVQIEMDLPGRLEAVRSAPIVPQVTGIVKRRLFAEGSFVKAGQPMYQLDDSTYAANLESARASLLSAQASYAKASADVERYRPLVEADAISEQEWDAAVTAQRSAQAQIKSAEAAIRAAQVNVNHAHIVAPISGIVGQSLVTEGALVTANSTQMATINQTNPLYINIQQSASEWQKLRQQLASGQRKLSNALEVSVMLDDGSEYEHKGHLLFIDPTVDQKTGQITIRAEVPNPDFALMTGLYARVRLPLTTIENAFVVPQQAVTRGKADTVMVVNAKGGMEPRIVKIAGEKGTNWVINGGLQPGDKVIVEGLMIAAMSGSPVVQAKEWQPGSENAQAQAPAASAPAETVSAPVQAASSASAAQ
ncbi:efflux RND transporter periplasmic adaptor subunit [Kingella negevensis]|uniref:efflux RND transporter periplasmic adaptor subunit n=1 Tax=Kingella negevensis TaxID=1522312 RepID=UPI00254DA34F|nr:efflux RND transporter periplasmic adaptor subunit [Kingella negevensis]MDK4680269.1 efflux RND transporter periplasmic adaptor subunit [Kingella negevensis]MDK4682011.1 efflux RND transporter periplasmic adaptor subunit [Kingella negevensis]MDK4690207.1 efflux RND transporter periplasmic adaptor subunit [Kingella negevensis]MDK4692448.1 efflux RND transporter periplasmic adaptor subunit [Kingella negevensis]MDK4698749.1 efflux RND transporter periplasmic adaptor subunit [Kingella negevensi